MKLPRGRPLLENTRLEFINLDNVLSAAKRERAHRITGYISIIYPETVELIFLRQGEPFNAGRITRKERKIVPISEVIERAKKATTGFLSEYATDDIIISLIISTITIEPIKANVNFTRLQPKVFIERLKTTKFNGFIWVRRGIEESYIHFENGAIAGCYLSGRGKKSTDDTIMPLLTKPDTTLSIFDSIADTTAVQATPAQVDMFCKIFSQLLKSYAQPLGESLVLKTFMLTKSTVKNDYPFIDQIKIASDLTMSGQIVIEPKTFTQAMAKWLDLIYESLATFLGKESEIIAKKVLNDYRFALKSMHFFNHTKLKM
jgi:hypothetical protein